MTEPTKLTLDVLEAALATRLARACTGQEASTFGFIAPLGRGADAPLVHSSQGFHLIAARRQERVLPGAVVRDALDEKIEQIEAEQMRKVYKKERDQLKEELVDTLLPRAFIRKSTTYACIAPDLSWILVDTASAKRAEELLSTLREVLGSLPVRPVTLENAPQVTFTQWLQSEAIGQGLELLDECELRDALEEGGIVRIKRQDLSTEEVQNHLKAGKLATRVALAWRDKVSCVLDDKLTLRRLRFDGAMADAPATHEDALAQQDADFTLMMLTLSEMLPELLSALGGEAISQGI